MHLRVSVWHRGLMPSWPKSLWALDRQPFEGVELPSSAEVVVVGGGYSGLWTSIHLKLADPDRSVMVLDANEPGFGASGRNGGWCSALFPVDLDHLAQLHGVDQARRMQAAMNDTVSEIGGFLSRHKIDCDWALGGTLTVSTNPAHENRLQKQATMFRRFGFEEVELLSETRANELVKVYRSRGGLFSPHCAALHPLKLVNGLVQLARSLGIMIVSNTFVTTIEPGSITLVDGRQVSTDWVVRATEGFTPQLKQDRRAVLPVWSYMIATEPLTDDAWSEIGWESRVTIADGRIMVTYAQRTADGRIAFGGRGVGYPFASRVSPRLDVSSRVHQQIIETMHEMFPVTRSARITHRWGGPLAVPRDWHPSVNIDHQRRLVTVGGYSGDGVAASHLAGRTAAALITSSEDDITTLPWVNHHSPQWEPEPLRWLGVNVLSRLPELADRIERKTQRPAKRINAIFERLS
jgi:glycine/D-amino acid oxidase-like deaminating enzyme